MLDTGEDPREMGYDPLVVSPGNDVYPMEVSWSNMPREDRLIGFEASNGAIYDCIV